MNEENINSSQILQEQPKPEFKPLEIGGLFKRTWQVYKSRFWTFMGIMLLPVLINMINIFKLFISENAFPLQASSFLIWFIWFIVLMVNILATIALLFAIKDRKQKIGIIESFKRGKSLFLPYFRIWALVTLYTVGGFILLIIPGIVFALWFQFAPFLLVTESIKGRKALLKSSALFKAHWWKVFLGDIFVGLIFLVILLVARFHPFAGNFLNLLFLPLTITFLFIIYEDLKELKLGEPQKFKEQIIKVPEHKLVIASIGFLGIIAALASIMYWTAIKEIPGPVSFFFFLFPIQILIILSLLIGFLINVIAILRIKRLPSSAVSLFHLSIVFFAAPLMLCLFVTELNKVGMIIAELLTVLCPLISARLIKGSGNFQKETLSD